MWNMSVSDINGAQIFPDSSDRYRVLPIDLPSALFSRRLFLSLFIAHDVLY
jgi:hypothetical protein